MKEYKVGIIGFGFIGKVHAYAYANLPFHFSPLPFRTRITSVCTGGTATAEVARSFLNADKAVTDFRFITENPDIDIVNICSPNDRHAEALLSAMAAGKHIYCDKPITATLAEAEKVSAALPGYRATAQMTFQNRFFPAIIRAKQLIDDGFLGKILEFRAAYFHSGSADPNTPMKWNLSAERGGGAIADLGSHVLDLLDYLMGGFASINAVTSIAYADRPAPGKPGERVKVDAEDCVMMLVRMQNGAIGNIEATKLATGTEDELRLEVHGAQGAIRFNSMDPHHLEIYDTHASAKPFGGFRGWCGVDVGQRWDPPATTFPGPKYTMGWARIHIGCLANFLFDVHAGRPGNPGLLQGIRIQRLLQKVRESAASGQFTDVGGVA